MFDAAMPHFNKDECNGAVTMHLAGAMQQEVATV